MGDIVLAGATSGTTTLTPTAVSGTTTLTLPATTDTLVGKTTTDTLTNKTLTSPTITGASITVASTAAPAFSAYVGNSQTITLNTATKVAFNTEAFDTNSNFDSTTNYRFTPTVAGYYQINAWIYGSVAGFLEVYLYKNGALFNRLAFAYTASVQANGGSCLIYLNGSTDYIEIYTMNTGTTILQPGSTYNYFQASMVRSA